MSTDPNHSTTRGSGSSEISCSVHPFSDEEVEEQENRQMRVAMKMVGSAMVFIGFLQVFLSVNTGAEISIFPMIIYFSGMALWAYSSVDTPSIRYTVIALSLLCAMAFMHFGKCCFGINI